MVTSGSAKNNMPLAGDHLVGPDGSINLGEYGGVQVAGLQIEEARIAIEQKLANKLQSPNVLVDVVAFNSKVFYVVTKSNGGDSVVRVPFTGNETVLDALAQTGVVSNSKSMDLWISRPSRNGAGAAQIMPIEWDRIASGENSSTNYRVFPGDRLFVSPKQATAAN